MKQNDYKTVLLNPIRLDFYGKLSKAVTAREKLDCVGFNTGNLLFVTAMREQLNCAQEMFVDASLLQSDGQLSAVIPASNFINPGDDGFIRICDVFLDRTDIPVTMAGLGAQSTANFDTPRKVVEALSAFQINFFRKLSERAKTIGVRGEFTAECLEMMKIHNYRMIGCPSAYPMLANTVMDMAKPSFERLQITLNTNLRCSRKLLNLGIKNNAIWVMQTAEELPEKVLEGNGLQRREKRLYSSFPGNITAKANVSNYMESNSGMFFSLNQWDQFYREEHLTFAVGSRFHGNIAALRNGVPALWITHDSRTEELTKALHLPHITEEIFMKMKYQEQLLEVCNYEKFIKGYSKMMTEYYSFLEENHLNYKLEMK